MAELERKAFKLETKSVDVAASTFEGFSAGIGNVDNDDDQIMPGAFTKTIGERVGAGKVKFLDGHNPSSTKNVWGKVIEADERAYKMPGQRSKKGDPTSGLWSLVQVSRSDEAAQTALRKIDEGILDALSIGYKPIPTKVKYVWKDPKYGEARQREADARAAVDGERAGPSFSMEWEWMMGRAIRQMYEVAWWETSLVTWGANDGALVISGTVKSLMRQVEAARTKGSDWSPDEVKRAAIALQDLLEESTKAPAVLRCVAEAKGAGEAIAAAALESDGLTDEEIEAITGIHASFAVRVKDTCPVKFHQLVGAAIGVKAEDPPAAPAGLPAAAPTPTLPVVGDSPAEGEKVAQEPAAADSKSAGRPETRQTPSEDERSMLENELLLLSTLTL